MRTYEIIQIYYFHCHPWFIPAVSFLHYDKTALHIQVTWRTVSVEEYARKHSLVNNLWLFLGLGNDDMASIIEGVIGENYSLSAICALAVVINASNSSSLHKHWCTYSHSMATFLISPSFSKTWSWWWIPLNYINKFISHTQTTTMS